MLEVENIFEHVAWYFLQANALDVDKLLENIFVFRVRDATEQVQKT